MPELYYNRRHLHDDGYIDQYRWHMVDTNLLENDIDEALGRGSHLDRRIARKIPLARRRTVRRSHSSHAPAESSCSSSAWGAVRPNGATGVGVQASRGP